MPLNPPTPASVEAVARAICRAKMRDPDMCVDGGGSASGDGKFVEMHCNRRAWQDEMAPARAAILAYQAQGEGGAPSMREALEDAREAIASLDEFALGGVDVPDIYTGESVSQYGIRDELLAKIDAALAQPATAGQDGELRAALDEYLVGEDGDVWCQRLKYGKCSLRKCLLGPDGKLHPPVDFNDASCPRYRLEQARISLPPAPPNDEGLRELIRNLVYSIEFWHREAFVRMPDSRDWLADHAKRDNELLIEVRAALKQEVKS